MTVSVIIPYCDKDADIKDRCIDSVRASTYKDVDIHAINIGKERSAQRNFGADVAAGKFLLFLDADMIVPPELIGECVDMCDSGVTMTGAFASKPTYDALYIPEVIVGKGFWIKVRNFERQFYDGTFIDCPRFIKKEIWVAFDEELTGVEDWDWSRRLKGLKGMSKSAIYHNEGKFSFWGYLKKKRYYCQWIGLYKKKYPNCPELSLTYRYWKVFWENGKCQVLLKGFGLWLAVMVLRIAVGITYLCTRKKS